MQILLDMTKPWLGKVGALFIQKRGCIVSTHPPYLDANNQERPMYLLDYRECMYIATKFNDEARAKLILRWDELEKEDREIGRASCRGRV